MRCLIRFRSRAAAGTVTERDRVFEGDALTLGRATDQVLHLKDRSVALEHARIARRGNHSVLSCRVFGGALVNGVPVQDARLAPGDVLQIGANILRIVEPPVGFDLAFTFELDPNAARGDGARAPALLRIGGGWLGTRRWSWLLFMSVLAIGLVLPGQAIFNLQWRTSLRGSVLPDDSLWSPGPLVPAHASLSAKCEACHDRTFERVRNEACLSCHADNLHEHATVNGRAVRQLASERCGSCHEEHQVPSQLVRRDDRLCAACHSNLSAVVGGETHAAPVTDFGVDHPEFGVTMLQVGDAAGPPDEVRGSLADTALREPIGLKFPHDKHLVSKGIKSPRGTVVMGCGDCHTPETGGARMRPINMRAHCAECHRLDFDPANPERQAPHGDAHAVWQSLREYYSARYLEGNPDPRATAGGVRRPVAAAAVLSDAERERRLRRAEDQARVVGRDLFERRACKVCHELLRNEDARIPYAVKPVLLTVAWMPAARFSHAHHGTSQSTCRDCHSAEKSHEASDILMPEIANCRRCHAGATRASSDRMATSCTVCHDFHNPRRALWRAAPGSS